MRPLIILAFLSLSLSARGASFTYITLAGQTNRVSDNGTALTFNGTPIGGAGVFTNISGVIKPSGGQTTNVFLFKSGLADNATNVALVVDTANTWTGGNLAELRNNTTNVFVVSAIEGSSGSMVVGPYTMDFYGSLNGEALICYRDTTKGESPGGIAVGSLDSDTGKYADVVIAGDGSRGSFIQGTSDSDLGKSKILQYALGTNSVYTQYYMGGFSGDNNIYAQINPSGDDSSLAPIYLGTFNDVSSGALMEIHNAKVPKFTVAYNGALTSDSLTASRVVYGNGSKALTSVAGTGIVKGDGTIAASGTDYAPATSGTAILTGNGSGGFSTITDSSGLAGKISDETGSGSLVFGTTATLKDGVTLTNSTAAMAGIDVQQFTGGTNWVLRGSVAGATAFQLYGEATNTLALRNGANAQGFNIYNTFTDASNYERGVMLWSGNVLFLGAQNAGTGAARDVKMSAGTGASLYLRVGSDRWQVNSSGHLLAVTDNTYDIGANGANRPANIYAVTRVRGSSLQVDGGASARVTLTCTTDGVLTLYDISQASFSRLNLGLQTSAFPALKRSSTDIEAVLADNTVGAAVGASTFRGLNASGTDVAGTNIVLQGGLNTGTAKGGAVIIKTGNSAGTSGSSAGTASERFHAAAKFVNLTDATATTLFTIPVAATNYVGLTATITIYATDGTDHQSKSSVVTVDAIAKTTTITPTLTQVDNTTAASAGTLTCTYTAVDNGSNVLAVKANATSSLTETVLRAKVVITAINSNGDATVTEL